MDGGCLTARQPQRQRQDVDRIEEAARALRPPAGTGSWFSLRVIDERVTRLAVRDGVAQPPASGDEVGAMLTAWTPRGTGYCATGSVAPARLQDALERAFAHARAVEASGLFEGCELPRPGIGTPVRFRSAGFEPPPPAPGALLELLRAEDAVMRRDARIVHSLASIRITESRQRFFVDGRLLADQSLRFVEPNLEATAGVAGVHETRTLGGQYNGFARQGGADVLAAAGLPGAGSRVAEEAIALAMAPQCPSGRMDLLLMPDQMMLQIHESIGHPLELDRILGDERNFAGGSFVTLDMFGSYRYGSAGLNVSFDPGVAGELGGYACDDDGFVARRVELIRDGMLVRPLGSALSVSRARALGHEFEPLACARASGWHRPTIDRMANLNVEPGDASLDAMIGEVERGVLMRTNASWSIDDRRDKFQFGCEWGRLIERGRLTRVVRNPGYRGRSATFWRSLARVGDRASFEVHGTPFCGKGEPGQVIRVGHAAPACLFRDVDVFGGDA